MKLRQVIFGSSYCYSLFALERVFLSLNASFLSSPIPERNALKHRTGIQNGPTGYRYRYRYSVFSVLGTRCKKCTMRYCWLPRSVAASCQQCGNGHSSFDIASYTSIERLGRWAGCEQRTQDGRNLIVPWLFGVQFALILPMKFMGISINNSAP